MLLHTDFTGSPTWFLDGCGAGLGLGRDNCVDGEDASDLVKAEVAEVLQEAHLLAVLKRSLNHLTLRRRWHRGRLRLLTSLGILQQILAHVEAQLLWLAWEHFHELAEVEKKHEL